MVASLSFALLLASVSTLVVRADVVPDVPGPGAVYKQGSNCEIGWAGDADSTTVWKGMAIELMTGDNFNMVFLTTVATDQDGSVDGTFSYPCPEVEPNSAIYFYQFVSPQTTNLTWTTRFTIAAADGSTTDPTESTQPGGAAIPWGTGALKDPSTAVAAPSFASGSTSPSTSVSLPSTTPGSTTVSTTASSSGSLTTVRTTSSHAATTPGGTTATTSAANQAAAAASTTPSNSALSSVNINKTYQAAAGLLGSALTFTLFF